VHNTLLVKMLYGAKQLHHTSLSLVITQATAIVKQAGHVATVAIFESEAHPSWPQQHTKKLANALVLQSVSECGFCRAQRTPTRSLLSDFYSAHLPSAADHTATHRAKSTGPEDAGLLNIHLHSNLTHKADASGTETLPGRVHTAAPADSCRPTQVAGSTQHPAQLLSETMIEQRTAQLITITARLATCLVQAHGTLHRAHLQLRGHSPAIIPPELELHESQASD